MKQFEHKRVWVLKSRRNVNSENIRQSVRACWASWSERSSVSRMCQYVGVSSGRRTSCICVKLAAPFGYWNWRLSTRRDRTNHLHADRTAPTTPAVVAPAQ